MIVNGNEIDNLPGRKAKSLLAYLLYQYPKPVHREILMDKFWGTSSPDSARNCLNVTLCSIRRSFEKVAKGQDIIVFQDECYGVRTDLSVVRDLDHFESYWKKGQQMELQKGMPAAIDTYHQAFAFYRGDLLENLIFEGWAESARDNYRETWLYLLDRLGLHFFEKEKFQICINMCQKMLDKDPCLEDIHRRLMACYMRLGMKDLALRQFKKCYEILKNELSVSPGKATLDLYEKIRAA